MKQLQFSLFFITNLLLINLIGNEANSQNSEDGWVLLFNGKDLTGWEQLNGTAKYKVENNEIIGITKTNTTNSFLTTNKNYGDYILEFDVMVDPSVNSGVQFRSNSTKDYMNGRVHGYQFELDPSNRAFSGGIYDEARRGWMYPLSINQKARKAFKNGVWNRCRIEAIGNHIRTWINGIQCANLIDSETATGFIALQVHSIGSKNEDAGKKIRWKNIRIKTNNLDEELWPSDPEVREVSYLKNSLTKNEVNKGWRLLWDGKTNKGWKGAKIDQFPNSGWEIKDGELTILATDGGESTGPGDIITINTFSSFELELEFKITKGANSGIKYFVDSELNKGPGSAIGCEFQILDDENHPDAKAGINGNRTVGSLYDLITAENLSVQGRSKQFKGVNRWNKARIVVIGSNVEHWLNNEKVIEYDRQSQMFRALVAYSKYKKWSDFGQWASGHILLQDHGNTVHYRSIKIREFN
ncbi:3-keto-disaccharide hydrolase [Thalassobellus sediminis]|uniref:3-keto-disaccharide hydrolase n=1 Tax=Thalassobellus sediminis TaxID=3367753 RepID=UPI0037A988C5